MNDAARPIVAVRPMRRDDVDAFATWGRSDDPLDAPYEIPPLDRTAADSLWRFLSTRPAERRPYAGLVDGRFAAQLVVRAAAEPAVADLGITLDPAVRGRGFGTRILLALGEELARTHRVARLTLDVAAYNVRAQRAYRSAGFLIRGERFGPPDPGIDLAALSARGGPVAERLAGHTAVVDGVWCVRIFHMERALVAESRTEHTHA
jgi:RimJ/RimL family protein N-acetyltransferase